MPALRNASRPRPPGRAWPLWLACAATAVLTLLAAAGTVTLLAEEPQDLPVPPASRLPAAA